MTAHPLSALLSANPVSVPVAASLAEVLALMAAGHSSCVLALDSERRPSGIFTEQDAVRLMAEGKTSAGLHMGDVMRQPIFAVPADLDTRAAYRLMADHGYRHLVVVDSEGRLAGVVSEGDFLRETIQRQRQAMERAQGQVRGLRQRLQNFSLMEQVSDAIFVADAESTAIVEVNAQACRSLGYAREELLALKMLDVSTSISDFAAWKTFRAAIRAQGQLLIEICQRRRDGGVLPVQINARLTEVEGHEYVVTVARDLSRIREQDAQLRLQAHALNAAANAIVITDRVPRIVWANAAFSALTGYPLAEALGRKPAELVNSGKQDASFYQRMWNSILAGEVWHGELISKRRDGSLYDEELTITPVSAEGREVTHFIAIKQDVSARKAVEAALRESEESWRGLFNSITEAIFIQDGEGRFLDVNHGTEQMYGYSREEFIGQSPEAIAAPGKNGQEQLADHFRAVLAGGTRKFEFWGRRKNGEVFPKDVWLNRGSYFGREVIIAVARDITQRKALEDELRHLAATDPLTGLANRRHFLEQMALALARQQRHDTPTALLMLDLDWFKRINDQHGHAIGDEVLKHVAGIMAASLRRIDLLGRLGGEEFAILLPDTEARGAHEFAERLRQRIAIEPAQTPAGAIPMTVSIGVTPFAPRDSGIDAILARADRALYRAKANGRNRVDLEPAP